MKSWLILIALAVGLTAVATIAVPYLSENSSVRGPSLPAPPKPSGPTPALVVEEDVVHKFGILPQETTGRHSWVFKNTGAGPLVLRGTSKTCSCTTAELFGAEGDKEVRIGPGESMPIEVTFQTKHNDGSYRQSVTIGTNDPERPSIVLTVEGTIRPALTTFPSDPSMNFMMVSNDEPASRKIALWSAGRPDLKITRMASSNPALISVDSRPLTEEEIKGMKGEKGYAVEVTIKPSSNLGEFAEEVLVETDHPRMKELRFKVVGKISGPITATPEKVTLRGATSSNGGSEDVTLWARGRTSVNFVIEKKPPGFEVAIVPLAQPAGIKGSKYKMSVKLVPGTESGRIVDEIVLKTDDPKVVELRVPVDVLVQGAR